VSVEYGGLSLIDRCGDRGLFGGVREYGYRAASEVWLTCSIIDGRLIRGRGNQRQHEAFHDNSISITQRLNRCETVRPPVHPARH